MKKENFMFGTFKNHQKFQEFLCHSVRSLLASDVTNQWVIHKYHKANYQSLRSELLTALLKIKVF
jgi:tRNA uridine 5-carbamoylmethylation protein Kti12